MSKKKMTFEEILSITGADVLKRRAATTTESARAAQKDLISRKESELRRCKMTEEDLLDLSVESTVSLRAVNGGWDAEAWVLKIQGIREEKAVLEEELKIAQATLAELFPE